MSDAAPPAWVKRAPGLSAARKFMLMVLWGYGPFARTGPEEDDGERQPAEPVRPWPSRATLMEITGQSLGTVKSQLRGLAEAGWIQRDEKGSGLTLAWREPGRFDYGWGSDSQPTRTKNHPPRLKSRPAEISADPAEISAPPDEKPPPPRTKNRPLSSIGTSKLTSTELAAGPTTNEQDTHPDDRRLGDPAIDRDPPRLRAERRDPGAVPREPGDAARVHPGQAPGPADPEADLEAGERRGGRAGPVHGGGPVAQGALFGTPTHPPSKPNIKPTRVQLEAWWDEVVNPTRLETASRYGRKLHPIALSKSRERELRARISDHLRGLSWPEQRERLTHVVQASAATTDFHRGGHTRPTAKNRKGWDSIDALKPGHWLRDRNFARYIEAAPPEPNKSDPDGFDVDMTVLDTTPDMAGMPYGRGCR